MPRSERNHDKIRNEIRQLAYITNEMLYLADVFARTAIYAPSLYGRSITLLFGGNDAREEMTECARAIRRQFKIEQTDKDARGETFSMEMIVPDMNWTFVLQTARSNVCTRVDTGRTELKEVVDYANAPRRTEEVPVIEWQCDPVLNGD